jgi:hypothetical protein
VGPPISFPSLALRKLDSENGEFRNDWHAADADLGRVNLNRRLTPYPLLSPQTLATYNGRFDVVAVADQFQKAQRNRQQLADDIYRRLLAVTGVAPPAQPADPTDAELLPRRWLAQFAVNIVDFIDEDDISTPFNFYTADDAGKPDFDVGNLTDGDAELPRYWVFGTELPHLVVNEVLAEYQELPLGAPITRYQTKFGWSCTTRSWPHPRVHTCNRRTVSPSRCGSRHCPGSLWLTSRTPTPPIKSSSPTNSGRDPGTTTTSWERRTR